jgi:hypothetical protein
MWIKKCWFLMLTVVCCLVFAAGAHMQETPTGVPDLIGMNIAQATAALNRIGMKLGNQLSEPWTELAGIPPNTISAQAIPVGEAPVAGGSVDVLLVRTPNVRLVYDENDLTLINNTGSELNFNGLAFGVAEGATPAAFAATRWRGSLPAGGCAQMWSVLRSIPKDVEGCERIGVWLTTNNSAEHFWTGLNSVSRFKVVQAGVERATCPAAPAGSAPMNCDVFLPADLTGDITSYLYFAYTPDRLIIYNQSEAQFMPLSGARLVNRNPNLRPPNQEINLGDTGFYTLLNPVANLGQLAPGQCILFTNSSAIPATETPEPCDVIGRFDIDPNLIFWATSFDLISPTSGDSSTCNAPSAAQVTVCLAPR